MHSKLLQLCQISYFITIIMSENCHITANVNKDPSWLTCFLCLNESFNGLSPIHILNKLIPKRFFGSIRLSRCWNTNIIIIILKREWLYTFICTMSYQLENNHFNAHEFIEFIEFIIKIVTAFVFVSLHRCACQLLDGIWGMHFAFFTL